MDWRMSTERVGISFSATRSCVDSLLSSAIDDHPHPPVYLPFRFTFDLSVTLCYSSSQPRTPHRRAPGYGYYHCSGNPRIVICLDIRPPYLRFLASSQSNFLQHSEVLTLSPRSPMILFIRNPFSQDFDFCTYGRTAQKCHDHFISTAVLSSISARQYHHHNCLEFLGRCLPRIPIVDIRLERRRYHPFTFVLSESQRVAHARTLPPHSDGQPPFDGPMLGWFASLQREGDDRRV